MCTISYEKCVCFLFLVILAVLSCSGFRIDNVAMTDISKRNSHTSTSLLLNSDPWPLAAATYHHRLRHQRHLSLSSTPRPARRKRLCPRLDASWKAYNSDAVVVARVQSMEAKCRENCTWQFKVIEWLKNRLSREDRDLRLRFRTDRANHCEFDALNSRSPTLVRTKINQSKEYILFLKTHGPHSYSAAFAPEINKNRTLDAVKRVNNPQFRPKAVKLKLEKIERSRRLKLVCKVRGFPIPVIYWKRNNTLLLHPNSRTRITQKKKRSQLVIRHFSEEDEGVYECVARGVDGKEVSEKIQARKIRPTYKPTNTTPGPPRGTPCNEPMKTNYCLNGGTCFYLDLIKEYGCECAPGFGGLTCDQKLSDQSSMYRQTPIYTCKIGLYTKYDNC